MIKPKKIKAGALQFVLFIGAVVAVLLLSFVLVSYSHNIFHKKTDVAIAVIKATDYGLRHSFQKEMRDGDKINLSSLDNLNISTEIEKSYWGLLEKRTATSKKGQFQFIKTALVGFANTNRPALYLKDNQRPLVLAGRTKITGTAYLPEQGVRMGNIYGNSYADSQLIFGKELPSSGTLPRFDTEFQGQLVKLTTNYEPQGEEIALKNNMVIKNSFTEPTKLIKGSTVLLDKTTLTGNIIIWAETKITVTAASKLRDVILIAPSIEIAHWTKGNFQALASESITIGKGCELNYPTVLAVRNQKNDSLSHKNNTPHINIDAYAQVRGMLVYQDKISTNKYKAHVKINEHSKIIGELYCDQNTELKGSVYGNITTNAFVALENGNIYQNHIYNASVNSLLLPEEYGGIPYTSNSANQVLKWLY